MIVTLKEILNDAKKNKYGVGQFNTINMEMARGVIAAAEELKSPVIIGTAEVLLKFTPLDVLANCLVPLAEKATVPVAVHFDHGLTGEKIIEAMKRGFSSVMYDCSMESLDENIRKVAEMTKIAHMFGATIEGEIGHVGANKNADENTGENVYTKPEEAKEFIDKTGVDALAVAIGTAHGVYKTKPKLDLDRLSEISNKVDVPLVLHGGSGLSDDDLKNCIDRGICKINIFTDINCATSKAVVDNYSEGKGMSLIINNTVEAVKEEAKNKILTFGSNGRV